MLDKLAWLYSMPSVIRKLNAVFAYVVCLIAALLLVGCGSPLAVFVEDDNPGETQGNQENPDDTDNDGVNDVDEEGETLDLCSPSVSPDFISDLGLPSDGQQSNDYDGDGCQDDVEDPDDDNDNVPDIGEDGSELDKCRTSENSDFISDLGLPSDGQQSNDYDSDGCEDATEDPLIDNDDDQVANNVDIDDDGDGLIEIGHEIIDGLSGFDMLDNIRNDLSGASYSDGVTTPSMNGCGGQEGISKCNGYELMTDITLGSGNIWEPVGEDYTTPFTGNFNGNGYTIQNFRVNTALRHAGFFGFVAGTEAEPIRIENLKFMGDGTEVRSTYMADPSDPNAPVVINIGVLAGRVGATGPDIKLRDDVIIDKVSSIGITVTLNDSKSNPNSLPGGLVGWNRGTIQNSYSTGDVYGDNGGATRAGGLVGVNAVVAIIRNSYSTGNVFGGTGADDQVGGFVGGNVGIIQNSYSTGTPDSGGIPEGSSDPDAVGGFVGRAAVSSSATADTTSTIEYCYATKAGVNGTGFLGDIGLSSHGTIMDPIIRANYRLSGSDGVGSGGARVQQTDKSGLRTLTSADTETDFPGFGWSTNNWVLDSENGKYPTLKSYKEDENNAQIEGVLLCGQGTNFVQCASQ